MTETIIKDGEGSAWTLKMYKGHLLPAFPMMTETMELLPDMSVRDDDVFIVGYSKSGNHWLHTIISLLLHGIDEDTKPDYFLVNALFLELKSTKNFDIPSPRLFFTHLLPKHLPRDMKRCRMVMILRHPKDIAVSYYNHVYNQKKLFEYNGSFAGFLPNFLSGECMFGSWFDYINSWDKFEVDNPEAKILKVYYEDLQTNFIEESKKIAAFLHKQYDGAFHKKLERLCRFDTIKNAVKSNTVTTTKWYQEQWRGNTDGMYRKGIVGDWQNWFTVSQSEAADDVFRLKLTGCKLVDRYQPRTNSTKSVL